MQLPFGSLQYQLAEGGRLGGRLGGGVLGGGDGGGGDGGGLRTTEEKR